MNTLKIRLFRRRDINEIAPILMDKDLKHTHRGIYCSKSTDVERVIKFFLRDTNMQTYSIVLKENNERHVIGFIIVEYIEKQDKIFLSYALNKEHRNKGIMTKTIKSMLKKELEPYFKGTTVSMYIIPSNKASIRVAEKIGAKRNLIYYELQLWEFEVKLWILFYIIGEFYNKNMIFYIIIF